MNHTQEYRPPCSYPPHKTTTKPFISIPKSNLHPSRRHSNSHPPSHIPKTNASFCPRPQIKPPTSNQATKPIKVEQSTIASTPSPVFETGWLTPAAPELVLLAAPVRVEVPVIEVVWVVVVEADAVAVALVPLLQKTA